MRKIKSEEEMNVELSMVIGFYLGDMRRRGVTDDSISTCKSGLARFARFVSPAGDEAVRLSSLTTESAASYIDHLQSSHTRYENHPNRPPHEGKLSPFTVNKEVRLLRGFGTWLYKQGFSNPFDELQYPKMPERIVDVLTPDEQQKIFDSINVDTGLGCRVGAMVSLMLGSGLRVGEVIGAKLTDLNMEELELKVTGKGKKDRIVPFGNNTARLLLRYVQIFRPQPANTGFDQLFLSWDAHPLSRNAMESVIGRLRRASGITRLHAHLFRHTFASDYLLAGGDPMDLKDILGHTSLDVTKLYRHLTRRQIAERYQRIVPIDRLRLDGLRRFKGKKKE